jgi:TP901 family phage tail tape measure protein
MAKGSSVTKTISVRLAVDGEKEYRDALTLANGELRTLSSELKLVKAQYAENSGSAEALRAKLDVLNKQYDAQLQKVEAARAGLANAQKALDAYRAKAAELAETQERTSKSFAASAGFDKTSDAYIALKGAADRAADAVRENDARMAAAQKGVNSWGDTLNVASTQLVKLKREVGENEETLKRSESLFGRISEKVRESAGAIDTLASTLAAQKLSAAAGDIRAALEACIDASAEFESAMTGVAKTTELSRAELDSMGGALKEMSTRIPLTGSELAGIAEAAGQLGIAKDDLLSFTEVMAKLGATTNLSASEAASELAKFANITKMSADDYERLGSVVVGLGNNFATTERDIVNLGRNLAAAGELAGVSQAETMGLAAALSALGVEAQAGGTALSKLMRSFETMVATGSDKLSGFAEVAGMSASEFAGAWKSDAMGTLSAFIDGLGSLEQAGGSSIATLSELGITETRMTDAISRLVNSGGLLTTALDMANAEWDKNTAPILAVASAVIGLVTAIGALAAKWKEEHSAAEEFRAEIDALRDSAREAREAFAEKSSALEADAASAAALVSRLSELSEKTDRTAAEQAELLAVTEALNTAVPGLNLSYDELNGTLSMTAAQILAVAEAEAKRAQSEAAAARLVELDREMPGLLEAKAEAQRNYNAAKSEEKRITAEYNALGMATAKQTREYTVDVTAARAEVLEYGGALTDANRLLKAAQNEFAELSQEIDRNAEELAGNTEAARGATEEMDAFGERARRAAPLLSALSKEVSALGSALTEQAEAGSLSIDTINGLIDAGYASALQIDAETGAVTVNREAYIALASAKIEEQAASLAVVRAALAKTLDDEAEAASRAAYGVTFLAGAKLDEAKAALAARAAEMDQINAFDAQIAALNKLKDSLGQVTAARVSSGGAAQKAADTAAKAAEAEAKAAQKAAEAEAKAAEDAAKAAQKAAEERLDGAAKDFSARLKAIKEESAEAVAEARAAMDGVLKAQESMSSKLSSYGALTFTETAGDVTEKRLSDLKEQLEQIREYGALLKELGGRGASEELMAEITGMGVGDAAEYSKLLLAQSDEQWAEYLELYAEKNAEAARIADEYFQKDAEEASRRLGELNDELTAQIDAERAAYEASGVAAGEALGEGMLEGLRAKEDELLAEARGLADALSGTIRDALGIHSPSTVGRELMEYFGDGMELGLEEAVERLRVLEARAFPAILTDPEPRARREEQNRQTETLVNAFGTLAAGLGGGDASGAPIEVVVKLDSGVELARALLPDIRAVGSQSPAYGFAM